MARSLAATILAALLAQDAGDAAAEKAKLDEELAKAAEPVADQLLKWKSWDEARAFLEVIRAKSDARAESLDKLLARTEKQSSGWEWDRRTCELIKQFGKERAKKYYAFARAWKEKDAEASRWTDTEGEILDDVLEYSKAFGRIVQIRTQHGLPKTKFDWKLSVPAVWHAKYILLYPNDDSEDPSKSGYTAQGKEAGVNSVSNSSKRLIEIVEGISHSPFQRVYVLNPRFAGVGLGQARGTDTSSVVNVESGLDSKVGQVSLVLSPPNNATDVPVSANESNPSSLHGKPLKDLGYPITATFFDTQERIADVRATLTENKTEVECYVSSPDNPALPDKYPNNKNSVLIIPKAKLKPKSQYKVDLRYTVKGEVKQVDWLFRTRT